MNVAGRVAITTNAFLWIYSSKTGQLKKFDNVTIYQRVNPFNEAPMNQYNAYSPIGIDRLVHGIEYGVWYYAKYREYLIWSKTDNDEHIKKIFLKTLRQRAEKDIKEALATIQQEHDVLSTAQANLLNNNCVVVKGGYSQVKQAINNYFYSL